MSDKTTSFHCYVCLHIVADVAAGCIVVGNVLSAQEASRSAT